MFPTHLSVNDLGVFAVAMVFGLIVLLLFMFDFKGRSKGPAIPGEEPSDSEFDPDRFSPENIEQIPSLAYQPFGFAGKHKCPGWRFSIAEGLVLLSVLIKHFKFHLVDGQKVKPVHRLMTSPAEEIWITITKR